MAASAHLGVLLLVVLAGHSGADHPKTRVTKFIMANMTSWFTESVVQNIQTTFTTDSCANETIDQFGTDCENILIAYIMPKMTSLLGPMNCVQSSTGQSLITVIGHLVSAMLDVGGFIYQRSFQACNTTMERATNHTARLNAQTRSQRVLHRKMCHLPLVQRIFNRWCYYASTPTELTSLKGCMPTFYNWALYSTVCPTNSSSSTSSSGKR